MREVNWGIEFNPVASIQRFKFMISANSEETTFIAKTEGNDLKFFLGDLVHMTVTLYSTDAGGKLERAWSWP